MSYEKLMGFMPEIRKAANTVAFKWPNVVESEDVAQDIFLLFMTRPNSVDKLEAMEPPKRYASLVRIGHQIAAGERNDNDVFSGNFSYSVEEVKSALNKGALSPQTGKFDPVAFDIRESLEALKVRNENYSNAIYQRYVLEVPAERNALNRGLEKLTSLMNRTRMDKDSDFANGGRYRTSVSNRSAVLDTQDGYEGVDTDD